MLNIAIHAKVYAKQKLKAPLSTSMRTKLLEQGNVQGVREDDGTLTLVIGCEMWKGAKLNHVNTIL